MIDATQLAVLIFTSRSTGLACYYVQQTNAHNKRKKPPMNDVDAQSVPTVEVLAVLYWGNGCRSIDVRCPYCGDTIATYGLLQTWTARHTKADAAMAAIASVFHAGPRIIARVSTATALHHVEASSRTGQNGCQVSHHLPVRSSIPRLATTRRDSGATHADHSLPQASSAPCSYPGQICLDSDSFVLMCL